MNLKAIKERCERYAEIRAMSEREQKQLDWDEWWGPGEMVDLAFSAAKNLPALLAWVDRAKEILLRADNILNSGYEIKQGSPQHESIQKVLAELDDAEIKGKGD